MNASSLSSAGVQQGSLPAPGVLHHFTPAEKLALLASHCQGLQPSSVLSSSTLLQPLFMGCCIPASPISYGWAQGHGIRSVSQLAWFSAWLGMLHFRLHSPSDPALSSGLMQAAFTSASSSPAFQQGTISSEQHKAKEVGSLPGSTNCLYEPCCSCTMETPLLCFPAPETLVMSYLCALSSAMIRIYIFL